jgi:RNA polymerase sigma-70 factor (ECF subfamily)
MIGEPSQIRTGSMMQASGPNNRFAVEAMLLERADGLREFLQNRIPSQLQGTVGVDDILQQVWIAAFKGYSAFEMQGADAFDRWLRRIAERKLINAIRDARAVKRGGRFCRVDAARDATSLLDLFAYVAGKDRTPSSEEGAREAVNAVQIAISSLPDDHRRAITMHHIEGRSHDEIAAALQKSLPAVNGILYRGMCRLREHLGPEDRFFSDSAEPFRENPEAPRPTDSD